MEWTIGLRSVVALSALGTGGLLYATASQSDEASNAADHAAEETYVAMDQQALNDLLRNKGKDLAFTTAFDAGDELTEISFTAAQGVGAHVGEGRRFTRFPRADLNGKSEWASHLPIREGGPNATSCIACHNAPIANGAGDIAVNVVVDPAQTGDPTKFLERNTLPLFALGVPQRLAEEMSTELHARQKVLVRQTCATGQARAQLSAKGVSFGEISAVRIAQEPCKITMDTTLLEGIDDDLIVRAFGWKGNKATIREFTRGAAHNELGLQATEIIGDADGDHDGVFNELTIGDLTALTVYMAALERPVSRLELASLDLAEVSQAERTAIKKGENLFAATGCGTCHVPQMQMLDPVFREPSTTTGYFDVLFPSGSNPGDLGLQPDLAITADLTKDQPNNRIKGASGKIHHLGALHKSATGGAVVNWYSDLKRHDMGAELADPSAPLGIGAHMWLTRSLAGVGSTGPWLHDGRATTLDEAIRAHGGEAADTRDAYAALSQDDRDAIVTFLQNLVIFKQDDEHE